MPYIEKRLRTIYDPDIDNIIEKWWALDTQRMAGVFTYIVYRLLKCFSDKFWMRALGIGCLVCAILEIYRRDHAVYENEKRCKNGDVK